MDREKFFRLVFYHFVQLSDSVEKGFKNVAEYQAAEIVGIFFAGSYFDAINEFEFKKLIEFKNKLLQGEFKLFVDDDISIIKGYLNSEGGEN